MLTNSKDNMTLKQRAKMAQLWKQQQQQQQIDPDFWKDSKEQRKHNLKPNSKVTLT